MPRRMRRGRKSKFVTKRSLPFQMMKYAETKLKQQNLVDFTPFSDPTVTADRFELTNIDVGDRDDERIGNEIQLRSVYAKFTCRNVVATSTWVRFILYSNKVPNADNVPVESMADFIEKNNFTIWVDKWVYCTDNVAGGGGNGIVTIKFKFKPYMKTQWTGILGTTVKKGDLSLSIIPSNTEGAQINGYINVYYKDL